MTIPRDSRYEGAHDAEHALYLVAGCLFYLGVLGAEPIRHRASAIVAFLMLLMAMFADSATGIAYTLQPHGVLAPYAAMARDWGPSLVADLHLGGSMMFIGSDVVMAVIVIAIALAERFFRTDADVLSRQEPCARARGKARNGMPPTKRKQGGSRICIVAASVLATLDLFIVNLSFQGRGKVVSRGRELLFHSGE